jgi:hypothetical protein
MTSLNMASSLERRIPSGETGCRGMSWSASSGDDFRSLVNSKISIMAHID